MKRLLLGVIVVTFTFLTGCDEPHSIESETSNSSERFGFKNLENFTDSRTWVDIIIDKETGVEYMMLRTEKGIAVTPLLENQEDK